MIPGSDLNKNSSLRKRMVVFTPVLMVGLKTAFLILKANIIAVLALLMRSEEKSWNAPIAACFTLGSKLLVLTLKWPLVNGNIR